MSLAFVTQHPSLPRQSFGVQWRAFCYLQEPRAIDLQVASTDDVLLQLDSAMVIRHNARSGPQIVRRSLTLTKGTHEIVIRYRQHGSGMGLTVSSTLPHGTLRALSAASTFAEPVSRTDMAIVSATPWLMTIAGFVWLSAALALSSRFRADPYHRVIHRPTRTAFPNGLVLLAGPALVAPVVMFLVGPLTIRVWAAMLVGAGFLLWAQGTVMVVDDGPLYGEALDFGAHAGRVPYELALWAGVLILAIIYARTLSRIGLSLSLLFVGLQVAAAVVSIAFTRKVPAAERSGWSTPPTAMYTLRARRTSFTSCLTAISRSCSARR